VAPEAPVGRERAAVGGGHADEPPQDLLLNRHALLRVEANELVQLARDHVVVPLLDDQESTPAIARYLSSIQSSIPYFEPSRPIPDSFRPPNGATSVEMKPVLMPTMP